MPSPILVHTVADLIQHDHTLGLYCPRCQRWAQAPLAKLAARGLADCPIRHLRFRCVRCGTPAQRQLRPPALPPSSGIGWIQLRGTSPWNNSKDVSELNHAISLKSTTL